MQFPVIIVEIILMLFILTVFTILLFHKGRELYSNKLLGIYFISQIIGISDALFIYGLHDGHGFPFICYPVIFTWAPLFYFYMISLFFRDFRLSWKYLIHLIPCIVVLLFTLKLFYLKDYQTRFELITSQEIYRVLFLRFGMLFNAQIVGYNIAAFIQYLAFRKKLKEEVSLIDKAADNWLKISLFGFITACMIVQLGSYSLRFRFFQSIDWYLAGDTAFLAFFSILFYNAIINPNILTRNIRKEKYKYSQLSPAEANKILKTLEQYMESEKPFVDTGLSLKSLSKMIDIPERYISQVINEYRQQNFFDFVNSYRVKYSMQLLKDVSNNRRIMIDIMFEAGFNSKSTFINAFKKHSGQTPSEFKKLQQV